MSLFYLLSPNFLYTHFQLIPIITSRSMSEKTTSLDIQSGKGSILDIAKAFPMTRAQTLDLARHGKYIDGMLQ